MVILSHGSLFDGIYLTPEYSTLLLPFTSYIPLYCSIVLCSLHLILFLSRSSFHSSVHHCAPEKKISLCHPDSASNMSQLPAINQRVQTRVYKHKSCRRFLQDYHKYFFRHHACHSKFKEYLKKIKSKV